MAREKLLRPHGVVGDQRRPAGERDDGQGSRGPDLGLREDGPAEAELGPLLERLVADGASRVLVDGEIRLGEHRARRVGEPADALREQLPVPGALPEGDACRAARPRPAWRDVAKALAIERAPDPVRVPDASRGDDDVRLLRVHAPLELADLALLEDDVHAGLLGDERTGEAAEG